MAKNVPPAHFGYMASGIDDEVTLRANREGFLKFQLRPRRLVDVSKVDMIDRPPRHEIRQPDHRRADRRATRATTPTASRASPAPPRPATICMILSTQATTSVKDVIAARGKPIWYQLYATNKFEVAKHHVQSAERPRAPPWSRSRSTAAAAATRRPCSAS